MDASRFDALTVTRFMETGRSRRSVVSGLVLGAVGLLGGVEVREAAAKGCNRPCHKVRNKKQRRKCQKLRHQCRTRTTPVVPEPVNVCASKNWCLDRAQTCGPVTSYGKCLVEPTGGNICAEILFQVPSCADCEAASCTNCKCVLAAGGGDRCNNGANGYDYICVREVAV